MHYLLRRSIQLINEEPLKIFCLRVIRFVFFEIASVLYRAKKYRIKKIFSKQKIVKVRLKENIEMMLDLCDEGLSYELLINKKREPYVSALLSQVLKPGEIVLDIGSNIGYYAILEAKQVGPKGKIYCLEPVPENYRLLKQNIKLNGLTNIETFQIAAGDKTEKKIMYVPKRYNWSSFIKPAGLKTVKQVPVQVVTIDDFLSDKPLPTFIRMDVEGYELKILYGMKNLLTSSQPLKIFMELHPSLLGDETKKLLNLIRQSGFHIAYITSEPRAEVIAAPYWLQKIYYMLTRQIEFPIGYLDITLEKMLQDHKIIKGTSKWLEVIFERT